MEKGYALPVRFSERGAEWQEVDCTNCVHYMLCGENEQCNFGAVLNNIAEGIEDLDVLKGLMESCKYCDFDVEEALHSWNCVHCKARIRFGDGPEKLALKNYIPRR